MLIRKILSVVLSLAAAATAEQIPAELLQYGPTAEVFRRPKSIRVARAFSDPPMNLLGTSAGAHGVRLAPGTELAVTLPSGSDKAGGALTVGVRYLEGTIIGDMVRMQGLMDDFYAKHPDIKVEWVTLEENVLRQKVTTDIATKGGQFDVLTIGNPHAAFKHLGFMAFLNPSVAMLALVPRQPRSLDFITQLDLVGDVEFGPLHSRPRQPLILTAMRAWHLEVPPISTCLE